MDGARPNAADFLRSHQAATLEQGEVLHDPRQADIQRSGEVLDRRWTTAELLDQRPPGGIGERMEHGVERVAIVNHSVNH